MAFQADAVVALEQRLKLAEQWNIRLQTQLQELLRLPQNDTARLAARMYNPEIAIPLLQCYDATIAEKQDEIDKLRDENQELRKRAETAASTKDDAVGTARLAEELARATTEKLSAETTKFREQWEAAQLEIASLKHNLSVAIDAESQARSQWESQKRTVATMQEELSKLRSESAEKRDALAIASKRLIRSKAAEEDERHATEAQKIQLELTTKENNDKLHEIERLRGKMISALKQATDNHTHHLRVVEEKHRHVVEAMRDELRAQEVTVLKLRAQLARVDVRTPGSSTAVSLRSTTEVLDGQARGALEMEVRRLHGEITATQLQRDEAIARYEQLASSRRSDADDRLADLRRDLDSARARLKETQDRFERSQRDLDSARDQLRVTKEKLKDAQASIASLDNEKAAQHRQLEEAKKASARALQQLESAKADHALSVAAERRLVVQAEQRLEETKAQERQLRDAATSNHADNEMLISELRAQLNEVTMKYQDAASQGADKDRTVESLHLKVEQLSTAAKACKAQLAQCHERLGQYTQLEQQWKHDARKLTLTVEQMQLELIRTQKDRDRLRQEMAARKF